MRELGMSGHSWIDTEAVLRDKAPNFNGLQGVITPIAKSV